MKETIKILLPIFLGFILIHAALIIGGIVAHSGGLLTLVPITLNETHSLSQSIGLIGVIGLTLHAYSLGGGTFTGLEAVSNNVQRLAEPRVKNGKRTMLYMAISLSFTAGGIILLYLLWDAQPVPGQTLNAVVFHAILGDSSWGNFILIVTLLLEAGLLFVAANTGFIDGPSVLANMAIDDWVPHLFRHLSNRLVVQNGLILMGMGALGLLFLTRGNISILIVLYSINVFITFMLSLLSVSIYWIKNRKNFWMWNFLISGFAFILTSAILSITLFYKFSEGGWVTLLITLLVTSLCLLTKEHYGKISKKLKKIELLLKEPLQPHLAPKVIDPKESTAVIFENTFSMGMHTLTSVLRLFPNQFKNVVILTAGVVDVESYQVESELQVMRQEVDTRLDYFVKYCLQLELPAEGYAAYGTDMIEELKNLSEKISEKYPRAIFFASKLIFKRETVLTRLLHNQTPLLLQHHLHLLGKELVIIPMKI